MEDTYNATEGAPAPYPTIKMALKNKRLIPAAASGATLLLGSWLAYRTNTVDFYLMSFVVAAGVYLVLKIALEVIELVAETLMPR